MNLPSGWRKEDAAPGVVVARAPGGKSGLVFYSFSDAGDAPTALHTTDRAFSIRTPIPGDLGKPWTSTSGLRFRQHILDAETNDHKSAVVTVLLGTAPSVSGSMASVMAVILTDDEAARRALAPALESISTF